ncbi:hypothetical protein NQ315_002991 [Exocentrus adspersus]|uniref:Uncharacterized protein n=1 Tax=Exocentrus adspersus TaxID=1586481 RepID=A0AAV8W4Y0_9CUCU|nr:hypothetical protein NQ315_002991 [Exocentrus adspersus]
MKFLNLSVILFIFLMMHQIDGIKGDSNGNSIFEGLVDLTTRFTLDVIIAITDASPTIKNTLRQVEENVINKVWDTILFMLNQLEFDQLNEMETSLSERQKEVVECIKKHGPDFVSTILNFTSDLSNDEVEIFVRTLNAYVPIINLTLTTNQEMIPLTEQLDNCTDVEDKQTCLDEASNKITELVKKFVLEIVSKFDEMDKVTQELKDLKESWRKEASKRLEEGIGMATSVLIKCI